MPIDNPEAVRFANERIRPAADLMAQLYYLSKQISAEYTATGIGAFFLDANAAEVVDDNSDRDGRHPITGSDVINLVTRLSEYVTTMEESGNARLNTIMNIAVNY